MRVKMMSSQNFLPIITGWLLALFACSVAMADVYKWVDKDGKTQYSDQPPIGGDATKMKRKSIDAPSIAAPASTSPARPAPTAADQELEFRKRKAEKEETEKKQLTEAENAKKNKEYCNGLKGDLRSHTDGTPLFRHNEKGERVFLDVKEHAKSKRDLEERIAKACR
jgi:Domain of unknown function (DUF4124)